MNEPSKLIVCRYTVEELPDPEVVKEVSKAKAEKFLAELSELSLKYGIEIECCEGINLFPLTSERGFYASRYDTDRATRCNIQWIPIHVSAHGDSDGVDSLKYALEPKKEL